MGGMTNYPFLTDFNPTDLDDISGVIAVLQPHMRVLSRASVQAEVQHDAAIARGDREVHDAWRVQVDKLDAWLDRGLRAQWC